MPTLKLNHSLIKHYPPEEKGFYLNDKTVTGLSVRVYPSGYKTFFYRYRIYGKSESFKIGKFETIGLSNARDQARKMALQVANGIDPKEQKKKRERENNSITFKDISDEYIKYYLPQKSDYYKKENARIIQNELQSLHSIHLSELSKNDVRDILNKKAIDEGKRTQANRIKACVSSILSYALQGDHIERNFVRDIPKFKPSNSKKYSHRAYTIEEVYELYNYCHSMPYPSCSVIFLMMFTGQRVGETLKAKREHIDTKNRTWFIPAENTKNKKSNTVYLSDFVMQIIKDLRDNYSSQSEYLFPTPSTRIKKDQPIKSVNNQADNIKADTSIKDYKNHNFRYTAKTFMAQIGIGKDISARALNHSSGNSNASKMDTIYNQYDYAEPVKKAFISYSNHLIEEFTRLRLKEYKVDNEESIDKQYDKYLKGFDSSETEEKEYDFK